MFAILSLPISLKWKSVITKSEVNAHNPTF
jgi:hypothetical protein